MSNNQLPAEVLGVRHDETCAGFIKRDGGTELYLRLDLPNKDIHPGDRVVVTVQRARRATNGSRQQNP